VVGILDDQSTNIYMPIQMAFQILSDDKEIGIYDSIIIKIKNEDLLDETITKIETRLMTSRMVTNKTKDFSISSYNSWEVFKINVDLLKELKVDYEWKTKDEVDIDEEDFIKINFNL